MAAEQAPAIESSVLEDFFARLRQSDASVDLLAEAVDLLHPGYEVFFTRHLKPLLDGMANERVGHDRIVGPALRGHPRWGPTIIGRRVGHIPRSHFISHLPERSFALPENQVIVWLLASVARAIRRLERCIGSKALPAPLKTVASICHENQFHQWLVQVGNESPPTASMIVAAERQRLPGYRHAADLARRRMVRDLGNATTRRLRTLDLLAVNWLAPVESKDLLELYSLALVIDVVTHELGFMTPVEVSLVLPGRRHVALFRRQTLEIRVFFDQSPTTILGAQSHYMNLARKHVGVMTEPRRPDITLCLTDTETMAQRHFFLEVKNSTNPGYIRSSIYKALGYLRDFEELFVGVPATVPKIGLMFDEGVRPLVPDQLSDVVLLSSTDRSILAKALSESLVERSL